MDDGDYPNGRCAPADGPSLGRTFGSSGSPLAAAAGKAVLGQGRKAAFPTNLGLEGPVAPTENPCAIRVMRKAQPTPALAEMYARDQAAGIDPFAVEQTPAPPAPPPPPGFWLEKPDWHAEAAEAAARERAERARTAQPPSSRAPDSEAPSQGGMAQERGRLTVVVVGVIADKLGAVAQWVTVPVNHSGTQLRRAEEVLVDPVDRIPIRPAAADPRRRRPRPADRRRSSTSSSARPASSPRSARSTPARLGEGPWFFSPEILHRGGKTSSCAPRGHEETRERRRLGPLDRAPGDARRRRPRHRLPGRMGRPAHRDGPPSTTGNASAASRSRSRHEPRRPRRRRCPSSRHHGRQAGSNTGPPNPST